MGLLDKLKFKKEEPKATKPETVKPAKQAKAEGPATAAPAQIVKPKAEVKPENIKGKTVLAHRVIVKPLITEKAASLGEMNKYVFSVAPKMNKVEVKKAIRTIYKVDPVSINIANFKGKAVRHGRTSGTTRAWKKAIVTLKPGDKIEVYEGV